MLISDLKKGSVDMTGEEVVEIYAVVSGKYAVYRTAKRVMTHYSDDDAEGERQRVLMMPLGKVRGEITAFMDGWREAWVVHKAGRTQREDGFDRRTADGLIAALRGDADAALIILNGVLDDIREERLSIGRMYYLGMALAVLVGWAIVLHLTRGIGPASIATFMENNFVVYAAGLGTWGAMFSIAIALHQRKIQTDLLTRDNLIDAGLRISIGAVSGVMLFALLRAQLINISLGAKPLNMVDIGDPVSMVIGFLAGFSERLVGDFLGTVAQTVKSEDSQATAKVAATAEVAAAAERQAGRMVGEEVAPDEDTHVHTEGDVDACLCEAPIGAAEATSDTDLPPAYGGVEGRG